MTFDGLLFVFFYIFWVSIFFSNFKDFPAKNISYRSSLVDTGTSKLVIWKNEVPNKYFIGTQMAEGLAHYWLGYLIFLYIVKNREIYEKIFWARTNYVLLRLSSGDKKYNSATKLDSFSGYYTWIVIALVE